MMGKRLMGIRGLARGSRATSCLNLLAALLLVGGLRAQQRAPEPPKPQGETTEDYNRRLEQLRQMLSAQAPAGTPLEYPIGAEDLLEITVFEAPELNRTLRVSGSGEITLPLVGTVRAAGLAPRALETVLEELLRRSYLKDPHVGVFVKEVQSHPVSVFGAVKRPGVFQIRGEKTLIEVLALAEGLAEDAGDTVLVERSGGTNGAGGDTVEVNLKSLLSSPDPRWNVRVHPGDIVKVTPAGIVYVVGEVKKPGGFLLRSNENISVLQALALAEGLTRTSAKSQVRIIRTNPETGQRTELPIQLDRVLAGRAPDLLLQPRDIVFVPNSAARSAAIRGAEAAVSIVSGIVVFRR